jgi:hypothetical protein
MIGKRIGQDILRPRKRGLSFDNGGSMKKLEEKLGYSSGIRPCGKRLTHSSSPRRIGRRGDQQRGLEFWGTRLLGMVVADTCSQPSDMRGETDRTGPPWCVRTAWWRWRPLVLWSSSEWAGVRTRGGGRGPSSGDAVEAVIAAVIGRRHWLAGRIITIHLRNTGEQGGTGIIRRRSRVVAGERRSGVSYGIRESGPPRPRRFLRGVE